MSKEQKLQIRNSTAEFLIFTRQAGEDGIEVRVAAETVWLTQKLMAALFEVDVRTINEHLGNIFDEGEQRREATIRKFRIVRLEGAREVAREVEHCNLDAIIWLAKVGCERMQEMADPARSLDRARETWQKHGRSEKWIQQRMTGQETRNKLTDYWAGHEIKKGEEYAILTNLRTAFAEC